jgi:hypothetical protein
LKHAVKDAGYEVLEVGVAGEGLVEREPERGREKSGLVSKLAGIWKR